MWYAKSLSSVGKPHPELERLLVSVGRMDFLEKRKVQVLSWAELCRLHRIASVDVVQLDCEGMDCSILRGLLAHCKTNPKAFPRFIDFEANWLADEQEVDKTLA